MTSPFTDFCIHCDQLIDKNENVLYYTRTATEIEKFHKQLYCSDRCKKADEQVKAMLIKRNRTSETRVPLLFKYIPPAVNEVIGSPALKTLSKISSQIDKEDHFDQIRCSSPLTSPFMENTNDNKKKNFNDEQTTDIFVSDIYDELKTTYQNLNPGKEGQSNQFLTYIYRDGRNSSENMAGNNYTLWLNSMNK